jgi:uncharacterized phage protein (TIGR01671 family)
MTREIKFRVWDKIKKEMSELNFIRLKSGLGQAIKGKAKDFDLMQYTGLKDKNGKEIYEGDVLKNNDLRYIVKAVKGGFAINKYQDELASKWTFWDALGNPQTIGYIEGNCEIIGNIHENPELTIK